MSGRRVTKMGLVIVALMVALVLSMSGEAIAGNTPPSTINTCTKLHHGVYTKTKVVSGTSCPSNAYLQTWVPPTKIVTGLGFVESGGVDWLVVTGAQGGVAPTGTMYVAGVCATASGAPLVNSGVGVVTDYPSGSTVDYWGIQGGGGLSYSAYHSSCSGAIVYYSGDSNYRGFSFIM